MKILFVNNFFYERGGAEKSLFDTANLLKKKGHNVYFFSNKSKDNLPYPFDKYFVSDVDYHEKSLIGKIRAFYKIYYNFNAHRNAKLLLNEIGKPDIVHINNIMFRIGPSIIRFFKGRNIPVVFHLRDYNLMCGAINLISHGEICEACKKYKFYRVLKKRCKGGLFGSLIIYSSMVFYHNIMKFFEDVDIFISPSRFLLDKYNELGFRKKNVVIPNFINTKNFNPSYESLDNSYVYFGRLSQEKGIYTLLKASKKLANYKFKIIGTGPLLELAKKFISVNNLTNVKLLGYLRGKELYDEIRKSKASILPSEWYENSSKAIIESMGLGKPVIASKIGGNPELVRDKETGYLFEPFNEDDLAAKITLLDDEAKYKEMGRFSRQVVEKYYNPSVYYNKLIAVYEKATNNNK